MRIRIRFLAANAYHSREEKSAHQDIKVSSNQPSSTSTLLVFVLQFFFSSFFFRLFPLVLPLHIVAAPPFILTQTHYETSTTPLHAVPSLPSIICSPPQQIFMCFLLSRCHQQYPSSSCFVNPKPNTQPKHMELVYQIASRM